ncbi:MAG: OmpA family protein [Chlamydiae bacterium]|nr:OmpA family protein [Chlamydiota bacterium]
MKVFYLFIIGTLTLLTGCSRNSDTSSWDNMKTAGRYMGRGIDSLFGKDYDSYLVENDDGAIGPKEGDFIPLNDKDLKAQGYDKAYPQPKFSPGENGIPQLTKFQTPSGELASVFEQIHFDSDDYVIRDRQDIATVQKIAAYMKHHENTFLCIAGNCDERASAGYNMALGTRRANSIRVLLIKNGVDFNRIYTISYGKEKPLALGHTQADWKINRRAEFKIFER